MLTQHAERTDFVARRTPGDDHSGGYSALSTITQPLGYHYRYVEPVRLHYSRRRRLEVKFSQAGYPASHLGYPARLTQRARFVARRTSGDYYSVYYSAPTTNRTSPGHPYRLIEPVEPPYNCRRRP
jgi:hypothetical protein